MAMKRTPRLASERKWEALGQGRIKLCGLNRMGTQGWGGITERLQKDGPGSGPPSATCGGSARARPTGFEAVSDSGREGSGSEKGRTTRSCRSHLRGREVSVWWWPLNARAYS